MAVDVGFGSLVEKFEEYFGKRVTRALLMLVGLAVAAVCMGAVWQWLVSPLLRLFQTPVWGQTIGSVLWLAVTIGIGVALGLEIIALVRHWFGIRKLSSLTGQARTLVKDADRARTNAIKALEDTKRLADETRESSAEIRDLTTQAAEIARDAALQYLAKTPNLSDDERRALEGRIHGLNRALEDRKAPKRKERPPRRSTTKRRDEATNQ